MATFALGGAVPATGARGVPELLSPGAGEQVTSNPAFQFVLSWGVSRPGPNAGPYADLVAHHAALSTAPTPGSLPAATRMRPPLATRNVEYFVDTGVATVNPWEWWDLTSSGDRVTLWLDSKGEPVFAAEELRWAVYWLVAVRLVMMIGRGAEVVVASGLDP